MLFDDIKVHDSILFDSFIQVSANDFSFEYEDKKSNDDIISNGIDTLLKERCHKNQQRNALHPRTKEMICKGYGYRSSNSNDYRNRLATIAEMLEHEIMKNHNIGILKSIFDLSSKSDCIKMMNSLGLSKIQMMENFKMDLESMDNWKFIDIYLVDGGFESWVDCVTKEIFKEYKRCVWITHSVDIAEAMYHVEGNELYAVRIWLYYASHNKKARVIAEVGAQGALFAV